MKNLQQQLTQYASYHRDPRNIATHFVGIPFIVVAISILFSRFGYEVQGLWLSPAAVLFALSGLYYLVLDKFLGLVMALFLAGVVWIGAVFAHVELATWFGWGAGLFVVGWLFQFIGHYYEGKKPAFVDDVMGLVIGPLFVVAEALFAVGAMPGLKAAIEAEVGGVAMHRKDMEQSEGHL